MANPKTFKFACVVRYFMPSTVTIGGHLFIINENWKIPFTALQIFVQRGAKKIKLSSVTHVPSGLMGCASAALRWWVGGRRQIQTCLNFFALRCRIILAPFLVLYKAHQRGNGSFSTCPSSSKRFAGHRGWGASRPSSILFLAPSFGLAVTAALWHLNFIRHSNKKSICWQANLSPSKLSPRGVREL